MADLFGKAHLVKITVIVLDTNQFVDSLRELITLAQ